jgi:hypothetical protein
MMSMMMMTIDGNDDDEVDTYIQLPLFLSAGKDLPATDSNGLCDPYIETTINGT